MSISLDSAWNQIAPLFIHNRPSEKTDCGIWKNHLHPFFKDATFADITAGKLMRYRKFLEKKGLSPQTVKHCLALLKRLFNKAKLLELYTGALPHFPMPTFDNQRVRYLTRAEAAKLLYHLKMTSTLWYRISLLALHTGMRAGEIFSLKSGHVNLDTASVCIFETKTQLNRIVPLNAKAQTVFFCLPPDPNALVFTNKKGGQIKSASKIFFDAVNAAGLNEHVKDRRQKVVFHSLRHTFASWLTENDTPIERTSQLLGHKSLEMTMRYAHLNLRQQRQAVRCLEKF